MIVAFLVEQLSIFLVVIFGSHAGVWSQFDSENGYSEVDSREISL